MKRFQIGMYGPDQIIVKSDGNIIFCQAGFPGIFVSAYSGVKETAAAGSRQGCAVNEFLRKTRSSLAMFSI